MQLQLSNNLEAVTAQYVDVRLERKLIVLDCYHMLLLTICSGKVFTMLRH